MIVKPHDGFLIASDSICFVRRYRCQNCDCLAHGQDQKSGKLTCENCGSELHRDDEIAYRVDEEK